MTGPGTDRQPSPPEPVQDVLPIRELMFRLSLERPLTVSFPGPTIRGMIGHGLKQVACGHAADCRGRCSHGAGCPYAEVFDGARERSYDGLSGGYSDLPPPMVLRILQAEDPALADEACGHPDPREVGFAVRLIGEAARHAAVVAESVFRRQSHGLGNEDACFRVQSFSSGELRSGVDAHHCHRPVATEGKREAAVTKMRFLLKTPYCQRIGGRMRSELDPAAFVRGARERVRLLQAAYGNGHFNARPSIVVNPNEFRVERSELTAWRYLRSSVRQGRVPIEGLLGTVEVLGPWKGEGWWMREMPRVGLGKYAAFGLGEILAQESES